MEGKYIERALQEKKRMRRLAQVELEERIERIQREIPEIQEIEQEIHEQIAQLLQLQNHGGLLQNIEKIAIANEEKQNQEKQLLRSHGYPDNALELQYQCPLCSDTGYLREKYCSCLIDLANTYAAQDLNQKTQLKLYDFSSFNPDYQSENEIIHRQTKGIFSFCKNYAQFFHKNSVSILMMGKTGLGKTHLSLAIANEVIQKGYSVIYDTASNLFRQVENEQFGKTEYKNTISTICDTDLLVIDDLAAEMHTKFTDSILFEIINTRMNQNKPTIISTNLYNKEFEDQYGQRIVSRVFTTYQCLGFDGKDVRSLLMQKRIAERKNMG